MASETRSMHVEVPAAVERLLTADVAQEIAATSGDQPAQDTAVPV